MTPCFSFAQFVVLGLPRPALSDQRREEMEQKHSESNFTHEKFSRALKEGKTFHKNIGSVYCPYFLDYVNFGPEGLEHLEFKTGGIPRKRPDLFRRFKLIELAPEVIKNSKTLQGFRKIRSPVQIKNPGVLESVFTNVKYYEFIAVLDDERIKVVVKQLDDSEKFFWTIIPNWKALRLDTD